MKYLKKKEILTIHKEIEDDYDIDSSIIFPSNLELALESPQRILFGKMVYVTLYEKAATLMVNLIKLHPFLDGNKRTGLLATIAFLEQNGRGFRRNANSEVDVSVKTAECTLNLPELTDWIKSNSYGMP